MERRTGSSSGARLKTSTISASSGGEAGGECVGGRVEEEKEGRREREEGRRQSMWVSAWDERSGGEEEAGGRGEEAGEEASTWMADVKAALVKGGEGGMAEGGLSKRNATLHPSPESQHVVSLDSARHSDPWLGHLPEQSAHHTSDDAQSKGLLLILDVRERVGECFISRDVMQGVLIEGVPMWAGGVHSSGGREETGGVSTCKRQQAR